MRVRVRRMIYIFEGSYWRTLCLSQHTSIIRLLRYIVIEKSYASISAALVRTCDQVGTRARAKTDYHPKGLEPKGLDPKGLEPKGSRVTDMGFVSGSPETVLQPRWSTFLVRTSFLSPKGAGLWTVDWQF